MNPYLVTLDQPHHVQWHVNYCKLVQDLTVDQSVGPEYLRVEADGSLRVLVPTFKACVRNGIDAPLYEGDAEVLSVPAGRWRVRQLDEDGGLQALTLARWHPETPMGDA